MTDHLTTGAADAADPPDRDDGPKDSTRLNWLEAQADVRLNEWYRPSVQPGKPERFFQLTDDQDEVTGEGADLRAAIDDAMRGAS